MCSSTSFFIFSIILFSTNPRIHPRAASKHSQFGSIIDKVINGTINKMVAKLPDPIYEQNISVNFTEIPNQQILTGGFEFSDLRLIGLKSIVATKIDSNINSQSIKMTIAIPEVIFNSQCKTDFLVAGILPVYGNGRNNIVLNDIALDISAKFVLSPKFQIHDLEVALTIKNGEFNINGIYNNPELSAIISELLDDLACDLINNNKLIISKLLSSALQDVINALVNKLEKYDNDKPTYGEQIAKRSGLLRQRHAYDTRRLRHRYWS